MHLLWRNLLQRRGRTLLTIASVAIGATGYLLVVGSAQLFLGQFRRLATVLGSGVLVFQRDATSPWSAAVQPSELAAVRRLAGARGVSRVVLGKTRLAGTPYFLVFGLDPPEPLLARLPILRGVRLRPGAAEAMVGERASGNLGVAPGQALLIRGEPFTVVGVYRTGHPVLDASAVIELPVAQRLFNLGEAVSLASIDASTARERGELVTAIGHTLVRLEANTGEGWLRSFGQLELVEEFSRYLGLLALLIAVLGVSNALHVNVHERVAELAILRVVGWSRRRIAAVLLADEPTGSVDSTTGTRIVDRLLAWAAG